MSESLRLMLNFDVARLQQSLACCEGEAWLNHFNKAVNKTGWTALPLRSPDGCSTSIFAGQSSVDDYADTCYLTQSPYFQQVLDAFKCQKHAVRLLALAPGAIIKRHRDHQLSFEDGLARIHIPIRTNNKVEFTLNDSLLDLKEGTTWYLNANFPHSVYNGSEITRVHLVLDCQVNVWLEKTFAQAGYQAPVYVDKYGDPSINDENVAEVITQLKTLKTDAGNAMALRLSEISKER